MNMYQLAEKAMDTSLSNTVRKEALNEADKLRKTGKVAWSKLGLTIEQVEAVRTLPDSDETPAPETVVEEPSVVVPDAPEEPVAEKPEDPQVVEPDASGTKVEPDTESVTKAKEKAKAHNANGEPRGGLTRVVESLLMDPDLTYYQIVMAVIGEFPKANTSTRSVASVAAAMRRAGKDVPMRRVAAKVKPAAAAAA